MTANKSFYLDLYEEHLEEASALYEQRFALLHDPELEWTDLGEYEARFEAHLDALILGEDLALEFCAERAADGDEGELYAAICLFCRRQRDDLLARALTEFDPEDEDLAWACGRALMNECPETWFTRLIELTEDNATLGPVLIRALGWRRQQIGLPFLESQQILAADLAWAYGRLTGPQAISWLQRTGLAQTDPETIAATVIALLRNGDRQMPNQLTSPAFYSDGRWVHVGLGGTRANAVQLLEIARTSSPVETETLWALGLLGDPAAVDRLLTLLATPEAAAAAALALNLITGADLYEEVFIPEQADEDELFDDEIEASRRGEPLRKADGSLSGENVVRLCQNPEAWSEWWAGNRGNFETGRRYRNGHLYSPACLLQNLTAAQSPNRVRAWAADELLIRYGLDEPFELEMPIHRQRAAIARIATWVEEHATDFEEGTWLYHGKPLK